MESLQALIADLGQPLQVAIASPLWRYTTFEICSQRGSELPKGHPDQKCKGRSVFQGNKVSDENDDHAIFAELGSSPASMEAAKIIDVFGSQPGYPKQQADARQAYTQALLTGIETWVRLPRSRWFKERSGMKDPVCPLRLALYGHPDSGGIWEQHCAKQLGTVGWVAVLLGNLAVDFLSC